MVMNKSACGHHVLKVSRLSVQGLLQDLLINHLPLWGSERAFFFFKVTPDEPSLWKTAAFVTSNHSEMCVGTKKKSFKEAVLQGTQGR